MAKKTQLRIYTINKGQMDIFLICWREQVIPLRRKFGFTVEAGWVVEGENRFVWLVSHEDGDQWDAHLDAYQQSPERQQMQPEPGSFVAHMELRFVSPAPVGLQ